MWSHIFAVALLAVSHTVHGLLRFPCSQLTTLRSDPIVSPDAVSAHLHQVIGGSSFNFNMPSTANLTASACSSCSFVENKSNYWSPTLYYQSPHNGTFKKVKQSAGPLLQQNGGMVVYYIQFGTVTAFPQGFRMVSGNPYLRAYNATIDDSRNILHRCITDPSSLESDGVETPGLPTTKCVGGIRTQINFPTCWDGVNLDAANHKDHIVYATNASFYNTLANGCPSTHPVRTPLLYLETFWNTEEFANDWTEGNSVQPFVWAMGDPTGYGYHADYMMGWTGNSLVNAMAQCNGQDGSCSVLTTRSLQDMNDCALPPLVDESIDQWIAALPGCNGIQSGPTTATPQTGCGATAVMQTTGSWLKNVTGWQGVGCASDTSSTTITGGSRTTNSMQTIEGCLNTCASQGLKIAGLENGNTCICGSTVNTSSFSTNYACNIPCAGNANDFCGASGRVAVYNGGALVTTTSSSTISSSTTTTTTSTAPVATQTKYGQCAGIGWTGPTVCAVGSTCKYSNAYYSQCL